MSFSMYLYARQKRNTLFVLPTQRANLQVDIVAATAGQKTLHRRGDLARGGNGKGEGGEDIGDEDTEQSDHDTAAQEILYERLARVRHTPVLRRNEA